MHMAGQSSETDMLALKPRLRCPLLNQNNVEIASLLTVPQEIRRKIYAQLFISSRSYYPTVLTVCHQISEEAIEVLYEHRPVWISFSDCRLSATVSNELSSILLRVTTKLCYYFDSDQETKCPHKTRSFYKKFPPINNVSTAACVSRDII